MLNIGVQFETSMFRSQWVVIVNLKLELELIRTRLDQIDRFLFVILWMWSRALIKEAACSLKHSWVIRAIYFKTKKVKHRGHRSEILDVCSNAKKKDQSCLTSKLISTSGVAEIQSSQGIREGIHGLLQKCLRSSGTEKWSNSCVRPLTYNDTAKTQRLTSLITPCKCTETNLANFYTR